MNPDATDDQADELFEDFDEDGSGGIEFDELVIATKVKRKGKLYKHSTASQPPSTAHSSPP